MSRVKISEFRAKQILLGEGYKGLQIRSSEKARFPKGHFVFKVDQGIKKRFKQGLVTIDKSTVDMGRAMRQWEGKGFSQFILEPLVPHTAEEEQYLSLERVRGGLRMLHTREGGVDIEAHPEKVQQYLIARTGDVAKIAKEAGLPVLFLEHLYAAFNEHFFCFLEINPLVVRGEDVFLLDAAALVDSAAEFFSHSWRNADMVKSAVKHPAEARIEALAATTPASLKLSVINPDGSLFFLLSGGGGSIVIADEVQLQGMGDRMGNYGEYSGGPSREETYLYSQEIIGLALESKSKRKAIVIAGGVANFTDVRATFLGIIDALTERADTLRKAQVKVFVRRGGPNEAAGLAVMKKFLLEQDLLGSIYGSDTIITKAVDDAIRFVKSV